MIMSERKRKTMIFSFTDNYEFTTRLQIKDNNVEIVDQMKMLRTRKQKWPREDTKIICNTVLKDKYINYENAKIVLNLDSLEAKTHFMPEICQKKWNKTIIQMTLSLKMTSTQNENNRNGGKKYNMQIQKDSNTQA